MDGQYIANMEEVLDFYDWPPKEGGARLCFDERPCQLLGEVIAALPMKAGKAKREDNEYSRNGTAVVLLAYDLDSGKRYIEVRERRTKKDYADFMQHLLEEHYANQTQVHIVQDNLNTHTFGAFYEHLPAPKARAMASKLTFHFTPKHGSWLNIAEIEFSALARQCLDRRIDNIEALSEQVLAWADERNKQSVKVHWSFTVDTAREKMATQYENVNKANVKSNN
ncbi:IS630 family transposase [Rhodocytophaga aerolata]|uniref:IS630 family transposase n=1 Tax=Rhodocytophaga aerolata TaxID=455078 RepID=A0ABT8RHR1_9BACT|nr:IS630 family transposase [Rhodocytophaga aerolata]MDO1451625.1 IS630 family transposase [Rhodocytophaga aerolata]